MTSTERQDKPKGFTQSLWFPFVVMSPFILFELYGYFSSTGWHSLLSRVITIQMILLTFLVPAYLGWALVIWIEKRCPSFFEEDCGIPISDEGKKIETLSGYGFSLISLLALILINIFLIPDPGFTKVLTIMGSVILGIGLLGLVIPDKSQKT